MRSPAIAGWNTGSNSTPGAGCQLLVNDQRVAIPAIRLLGPDLAVETVRTADAPVGRVRARRVRTGLLQHVDVVAGDQRHLVVDQQVTVRVGDLVGGERVVDELRDRALQ